MLTDDSVVEISIGKKNALKCFRKNICILRWRFAMFLVSISIKKHFVIILLLSSLFLDQSRDLSRYLIVLWFKELKPLPKLKAEY